MGNEYFKRPVRARGLQVEQANSTFTKRIILSGSSAGLTLNSATASVTAADITLSAAAVQFVTVGTSGSGREVLIPAPRARGDVRYIFFDNQTTSVDTRVHTNSTANVFWGTTYNTLSMSAASTGSPGGTPGGTVGLVLVGASTTQWALMVGTTFNWDLSASTGSTGIA